MKMVKPIVFVLVVAFFAVNSPVLLSRATLDEKEQITLTESSSLEDYLAYGALNNPGLQAAFQEWQAALERIPQVRALPDPRLTFAYLIREVETRVGPRQAKIGSGFGSGQCSKTGIRQDKIEPFLQDQRFLL
jgi:hypothetical protein